MYHDLDFCHSAGSLRVPVRTAWVSMNQEVGSLGTPESAHILILGFQPLWEISLVLVLVCVLFVPQPDRLKMTFNQETQKHYFASCWVHKCWVGRRVDGKLQLLDTEEMEPLSGLQCSSGITWLATGIYCLQKISVDEEVRALKSNSLIRSETNLLNFADLPQGFNVHLLFQTIANLLLFNR